jgi:hypothetical protein
VTPRPFWTLCKRAFITRGASSFPAFWRAGAQVAQLVEHVTENHGVGGSIPPLGTTILFLLSAPPILRQHCIRFSAPNESKADAASTFCNVDNKIVGDVRIDLVGRARSRRTFQTLSQTMRQPDDTFPHR